MAVASGRDCLKGPGSIVNRELGHYPTNSGGKEISGRKHNDRHPQHRKIESLIVDPAASSFAEDANRRHMKLLVANWTPHDSRR